MSPLELSPALIDALLGDAGFAPNAPDTDAEQHRGLAPGDQGLGAHQVLRYAVADEADAYRRIMRVLYIEHQSFGLRLRPAQVADRLRERFGRSDELDWLEARLRSLSEWGAVEQEHDGSLATSAAEWRRNRYTYDVTAAGRLTEELLAQLDVLGEEVGRLDTNRLPTILDKLSLLDAELARAEPDGNKLRELFEELLGAVEQLHVGALTFMRSLGDLLQTVERVGQDEFERGKQALLEHLQGFRRSRSRYSGEILSLLESIERRGATSLVDRIVATEQLVQLPGGPSVEEQRARRRAELLGRWQGLTAWFVGEDDRGSPWRTLNDQVVDAIRAVLAIAERLIERRSTRIDRAQVLLALAARVAAAPPGDATPWLRAAFGLRTPRHVGVPESDPDQVTDRGRTPWHQAPAAPVVAYLRTPGAHTPGRGRGTPIRDLSDGRRQFLARRAAERDELERLLTALAARGSFRVSALETVGHAEFTHLLDWIGRAYEAPSRADGSRAADSRDGRAEIVLRAPADRSARTRIRAPHGTLELPDYEVSVTSR